MDTAFKRRWNFKYLGIDDGEKEIKETIIKFDDGIVYWNDIRKAINKGLLSFGINEDKLLGPFFAFAEYKNKEIEKEKFEEIFQNKIIMYLFEDAAKSRRNDLFKGAKDKDENHLIYSRIRKEFKEKGFAIFCEKIQKDIIDSKIKAFDSSNSVIGKDESNVDEIYDDSETTVN